MSRTSFSPGSPHAKKVASILGWCAGFVAVSIFFAAWMAAGVAPDGDPICTIMLVVTIVLAIAWGGVSFAIQQRKHNDQRRAGIRR